MIGKHSGTPLIGMPARMYPGKHSQELSRHYADAVLAVGGTPIILPLVESPESLRSWAENLDGIVLTGSPTDVDPANYSKAREEACGPVQPLRDNTDFMLLEAAAKCRIPVLAICFGLQSLNVFAGGSLIQDIPTHVKTSIRHSNPRSNGRPSHSIDIFAGSLLEELAEGLQSKVNSTHHQAIDRVGRDLEVIARAPDGIIEGLVGRNSSHWILGVQWHPEKSFSYDRFSRRIFERFMASCTGRRETYARSHSKDTQGDRRKS